MQVLEGYTDEQRARMLQFVTGTSGVPSQGFAYLQGNDGNIRKFTILGTSISSQGAYPHSHTCFNRIHLPMYDTKEDLKEYVTAAISVDVCGFNTI